MILAIECSTVQASLYLSSEESCLYSASWEADRNLDASLFPYLEQALAHLQNKKLELILIGSGPGSYGSIRVALAAATGIALAHNVPVITISSWEALPQLHPHSFIFSDARRNSWAYAQLENGFLISEIQVTDHQALLALIENKDHVYSTESSEHLVLKAFGPKYHARPSAEGLILAWKRRNANEQNTLRLRPPTPLYVRPPHITQSKRLPWTSSPTKNRS